MCIACAKVICTFWTKPEVSRTSGSGVMVRTVFFTFFVTLTLTFDLSDKKLVWSSRMWFYISITNFNNIGQVLTEIWIFEISPHVRDREFFDFRHFFLTLTFNRFRPKSIGFVRWGIWTCRKKMEMIYVAVWPASCRQIYKQKNKQKNKWKRSKRATLAKSIFFWP